MNRRSLLLLVTVALATPAAAQEPESRALPGFWVSVGVGPGRLSGGDIAAEIAGFYQTGSHLFSIRNSSVGSILGGLFGVDSNVIIAEDFGVLYGRATAPGLTHGSFSAGVGVAKLERGDGTVSTRFAVPVEAHVAFRPLPFLGVGITGFVSLNGDKPFGGVLLSVQAGRLR